LVLTLQDMVVLPWTLTVCGQAGLVQGLVGNGKGFAGLGDFRQQMCFL
jgi:hypothetical protein